MDTNRVLNITPLGHLPRGIILVGTTRKTDDHGIIIRLDPVGRDLQPTFRAQGHVILRIGRGFTILVGINPEDGEVARMARPHPIVGIGPELADRRGRRPDQTDIRIDLLGEHIILVPIIKGLDLDCHSGMFLELTFATGPFHGQLIQVGRGGKQRLVLLLFERLHHVIGHVLYLLNESDSQSRIGQLLLTAHGPEAIRQVVVLHRAMPLDIAITAMVIGQHQTIGRDDLTRTTTAKTNHSVFQRNTIRIINVVGLHLKPHLAHLRIFLLL